MCMHLIAWWLHLGKYMFCSGKMHGNGASTVVYYGGCFNSSPRMYHLCTLHPRQALLVSSLAYNCSIATPYLMLSPCTSALMCQHWCDGLHGASPATSKRTSKHYPHLSSWLLQVMKAVPPKSCKIPWLAPVWIRELFLFCWGCKLYPFKTKLNTNSVAENQTA